MLAVLGDFEGGLAGLTVFTDAAEVKEEREDRRLECEPDFSLFIDAPRLLCSGRPRKLPRCLSILSPFGLLLRTDEGVP